MIDGRICDSEVLLPLEQIDSSAHAFAGINQVLEAVWRRTDGGTF